MKHLLLFRNSIYLKYIILFFVILYNKIGFSQEGCDFIPIHPQVMQFKENDVNNRYFTNKLVKIYFHVYRRDDGSGGVDQSRLDNMIEILNTDYENTGFSFYYNSCETRWVNNTDTTENSYRCRIFFQPTSHDDGIDIHVLPDWRGRGGDSSEQPGGEFMLSGKHAGTNTPLSLSSTVSHEMGHCLGLLHTHHGMGSCEDENYTDPCTGITYIGGNETDNDYISDTPPDPGIGTKVNKECEWNGQNSCGVSGNFNPLINNIMSYTYFECRTSFTEGQISKMHALVWPEVVHEVAEGCCVSGENPPLLSSSFVNIQCPIISFDLNSVHVGIIPANSVLIWSTDNNPGDGLNPVINNSISTNGTYYAYYHDAGQNCYSASSNVIVTFQQECCNLGGDVYLTGDEKYTNPRSYAGNIFVQNGATLTIKSYIEFAQNKSIIVQSGGKLILDGCLLNICQSATFWGGIKVESGGELLVRNATINKAMDAVFAKTGSKIDIDYLTVFGLNRTTGTGLKLEQNVTVENIKRIKIHDVGTAIEIRNSDGINDLITIDGGEINNVLYAIGSVSRSLIIKNLTITNSDYGILMYFCPGSMVLDNTINSIKIGILAGWSPFLMVNDNQFSINQNPKCKNAVNLFLSGNSSIVNNLNIEASELGVSLWQSPFTTVAFNIINIVGINNQFGGGVKLNGSSNCSIHENYLNINESSFGIESVVSTETKIFNNQLDYFSNNSNRTAAIRSMGGSEEIIELNNAYGGTNSTGILAQNSSFNTYHCNVAITGKEGIGIYYNSEIQNIQANLMDNSTDLSIRSAIGTQLHHGNEFYGGKARADELNFNEVALSQFFVNSNISFFMPNDVVPSSEWFFNESEEEFPECDPQGGPSWTPFNGNNPTGICSYFEYLKSIADERPKQFMVKMIHLVKYLKKQKNVAFPNCIQTDSTYMSLCGLPSLVDIAVALDSLGDYHFAGNQIQDIQDHYVQDTLSANSDSIAEDLQSEVEYWHDVIVDRTDRVKVILDSLQNELDQLVCSDTLVQKWKDVYRIYMKYIKTDSIATADRGVLSSLSRECSDLYGDAIHLARAMVNTYSLTYFDVFDGCGTELRYSLKSEPQDISVFPNPTEGKVHVRFQESFDGVLDISDTSGKLILQKKIKNTSMLEIDLFRRNGIYIFRFTNNEGNVINKKIVVIE
jgi:hypothetical protein